MFIEDNLHLRYPRPWEPYFPYCTKCGIITVNLSGVCTGCLTGTPWSLVRTTKLSTIIYKEWGEKGNCSDLR